MWCNHLPLPDPDVTREQETGQQEPLAVAYAAMPLLDNTTAQMLGA